ncbi:MAG: Gldg family protein, partial [Phycisphaerales bacterium]|nr:Gldg family protein [Phycisphaerales bacterium]
NPHVSEVGIGMLQRHVIFAILRRELGSYFSSPTGYVFITIFVFLSAFVAFWLPGFFTRNLANLDQLNTWFPGLLLFLIPAITMGAWAQERSYGTDELLLTLPARDREIVIGKYLACLAIYTVALLFSLSHAVVLTYLGNPDPGLLLTTYLGYWLAGAGLIAVAMIASTLTANLTVAFILAALICSVFIAIRSIGGILPGGLGSGVAESLSLPARFSDFGRGIVDLDSVMYFAMLALLGLAANTFLVSRRHWAGSPGAGAKTGLALVRGAAWIIAGAALLTLLGRSSLRADATREQLWSLSPETKELVRGIDPQRPVLVTAWVTPDPPAATASLQETLVGLLRELDAASGGDRIAVRIVETEPYSEEAREARRNYNVMPRTVYASPTEAQQGAREVFLSAAFTCGPEQFVIPFFSPGVPVEYELARSIRTVSQEQRRTVGIVETEANLFGGFDFQTMNSRPDWPIVSELRKQYDVVTVARPSTGTPLPENLDVLIIPQPSALENDDMGPILSYIRGGGPTLIFEDPLPMVNPGISTSERRNANQNPFNQDRGPQLGPKADLKPLYTLLGIDAPPAEVIWDTFNPHPQLADAPREFVFVGANSTSSAPFSASDPVTSGLQEVLLVAPGGVRRLPTAPQGVVWTPLLRTTANSGFVPYDQMLTRGFFGPTGLNPNRQPRRTDVEHVLAARITGSPTEGAPALNVVFIADLDIVSSTFFDLRNQGGQDFVLDNVTMILNAVDDLAGDRSLLELRKRRRMHRTLTRLDAVRDRQAQETLQAVMDANDRARVRLEEAQRVRDERVAAIRDRTDLDDRTKQIQARSVAEAEQRKLDVQSDLIDDEKARAVEEAQDRARSAIRDTQFRIRLAAVAFPPVPALLLAGGVFIYRRIQERQGVVRDRLR